MDFATIKALEEKNVKKGIEGCQKISLNAVTSFKNNPSTLANSSTFLHF
jgi:hypothetical protein